MNNTDAVFDALNGFSDWVHLNDDYRKKAAQISEVNSRLCGNCDHWMKTTCVPEKQHKQFKSRNSIACGAFRLSDGSRRLSDKFVIELEAISTRLAALRREA